MLGVDYLLHTRLPSEYHLDENKSEATIGQM